MEQHGGEAHLSPPPNAVAPVYEYDHRSGRCAVTGGYVYRGTALSALSGWYVFGDYCSGAIRALSVSSKGPLVYIILSPAILRFSSLGQDQQGELYVLSLKGTVYKLVP
jgi:hypothetical protein